MQTTEVSYGGIPYNQWLGGGAKMRKNDMAQFRRIVPKNLERFIFFASGVLVSAIVSGTWEKVITWSEGLLVATTVVIVIASVYFLAEISHRIQNLSDRIGTTVYYVEELYREQEGVRFRGIVFNELQKLVSEAKGEILALAATIEQGRKFRTTEHPSRALYLSALEETIVRRRESGFKYVRINQVPREGKAFPLIYYLGTVSTNHCRRILELERQADSTKLTLSIMKVPTQRLASFMIVDRRYIVLEADGIDPEGNPYAAGMFFIEDKEGKLIERFLWYFDNLERLAQPVTLDELVDVSKQNAAQHAAAADAACGGTAER